MDDTEIQVEDNRSTGWFRIDNALLTEYGPQIGAYGVAVYAVLAMYGASKDRGAWPKQSTIAALLDISRKAVNTYLVSLEEAGLIEAKQTYKPDGGKGTKVYRIRDVTTMNDVTHGYKGCNPGLQLNNTNRTRHTTYGEEASPSPSATAVTNESVTRNEAGGVWESTKGQPLRSRCLVTIRAANEQLTASGKADPRAKASALRTIYLALFGDTYPPEIPRLMKLAGQAGGPERLVLRMLEASTKEVVGNPHDFLTRWKSESKPATQTFSPWDLSSD